MNYPNPWEGVAEGINSGVTNAVNILGAQRAQTKAAQDTQVFNQTAADYAYKHDKVTSLDSVVGSLPGLDKTGQDAMAARARAAGYGDRLSRTEVASLSDEFDKKPEHQLAYNNERIRTLDDLIKNHAIPPDKQELLKSTPDGLATLAKNDSEVAALTQSMADLKKYGTDREMKIEAAKNAEKTATAHETTAVAAKITAERKEVQVPKTLTEAIMSGASKEQIRQIIDAEVEIKKKTPGADPYALADYRAALKEKADELKATAKEAATNKAAWTKHSEAEAAGIAKAGSLTNVPQGTIDAWNTVRRNLGKGEYDYELASSFNPFSTYSKITAPKDAPAAIAPVQVWTKDKTGKPVPVRN